MEFVTTTPRVDWIRMPSGTTMRLSKWPLCRKIARALVEERVRRPGHAVTRDRLMALVWPDAGTAHRERFRIMMRRLRAAGFDEIVIRLESGYLLNPTIPVDGYAGVPCAEWATSG